MSVIKIYKTIKTKYVEKKQHNKNKEFLIVRIHNDLNPTLILPRAE